MRHLVIAAVALAILTSACNLPAKLTATVADTKAIESVFPLIGRLRVEEYSLDEIEGCRDLQERRGIFVSDISPDSPCDPTSFPDPKMFDAAATQDFDALTAAFRAAGVSVHGFTVLQAGGVMQSGNFSIGCGDVLIYQPGYGPLEDTEVGPNQKVINAPLTSAWYEDSSVC